MALLLRLRRRITHATGATDTHEKAVGKFKTLPIGRFYQRVAGAKADNTKPAQDKVSEVGSSTSPNIIKGRFGSSPEGKFNPAQMPITTGAIGCPTTLALKPAQPAHELVPEPAHRAVTQYDPTDNGDASDAAAERAVAGFYSMLDKGKKLR